MALHEASHICYSNFEAVNLIKLRLGAFHKKAKLLGIPNQTIDDFIFSIVNYVEDRYLDDFMFKIAPGYRPYYTALYDKYYNNDKIGEYLESDLMRIPTLKSYEGRIFNFTNTKTDLNALPKLYDIAKILDLTNIGRLKTTKERIKIAFEICDVIMENLVKEDVAKKLPEAKSDIKSDTSPASEETTDDVKPDDSIFGGQVVENEQLNRSNDSATKPTPNSTAVDQDRISSVDKDEDEDEDRINEVLRIVNNQKNFLSGIIKKKSLSEDVLLKIEQIELSQTKLVRVGENLEGSGNVVGVDCVVVQKMDKNLMNSDIFPLIKHHNIQNGGMDNKYEEDVIKGLQLGAILGKKLQIRQENRVTKYIRKSVGKVDRRLLASIPSGNKSFFYRKLTDSYNKLELHISVDASTSMEFNWSKTITMVTAICKAASMINNLRVRVSFRTSTLDATAPYIVMAYDSDKDKIQKIRSLFPHLEPCGSTPEGLAFEAIIDQLVDKKTDFYFLNISDGEPWFISLNHHFAYSLTNGVKHTNQQIKKIINSGGKVLSFFIANTRANNTINLNNFKAMYGKDAKFIDVNSIVEIARTMNSLFLEKE